MTRIDLNRVWDDAKAMGVANKDLLAAISGMFVLLPSVVGGLLAKEPANTAKNVPVEEAYRQLMQFYSDNWPIFVAVLLAVSFGLLAMLALLLRPERLTVGESLKAAIVLLPGYLVASLIQGFGMGLGFLLFVVPGLYVLARLSLIAPVAAAEQCANPLEQLRRSLVLTRGNGLRILLMLLVLYFTAEIVSIVATILVGLVGAVLLPKDIAALCVSITSGLAAAGLTAFLALLSAAIYRAATPPEPTPWLTGVGR